MVHLNAGDDMILHFGDVNHNRYGEGLNRAADVTTRRREPRV